MTYLPKRTTNQHELMSQENSASIQREKEQLELDILKLEKRKLITETTKNEQESNLMGWDFVLKLLIFAGTVWSAFFVTQLYDIKKERLGRDTERLEDRRSLLQSEITAFELRRDSLSVMNDSLFAENNYLKNKNQEVQAYLDRFKAEIQKLLIKKHGIELELEQERKRKTR